MKAKNPDEVMQGKRASIPSKHLQEDYVKDVEFEDKEAENAANAAATRKDILKNKRDVCKFTEFQIRNCLLTKVI